MRQVPYITSSIDAAIRYIRANTDWEQIGHSKFHNKVGDERIVVSRTSDYLRGYHLEKAYYDPNFVHIPAAELAIIGDILFYPAFGNNVRAVEVTPDYTKPSELGIERQIQARLQMEIAALKRCIESYEEIVTTHKSTVLGLERRAKRADRECDRLVTIVENNAKNSQTILRQWENSK